MYTFLTLLNFDSMNIKYFTVTLDSNALAFVTRQYILQYTVRNSLTSLITSHFVG